MSVGVGVVRPFNPQFTSTPFSRFIGRTRELSLFLFLSLSVSLFLFRFNVDNDDYDDYVDGGRCVWGRFARKIAPSGGAQSRGTHRGVRLFRRGVCHAVLRTCGACVRARRERDDDPICAFRAGVVRTMCACR